MLSYSEYKEIWEQRGWSDPPSITHPEVRMAFGKFSWRRQYLNRDLKEQKHLPGSQDR